VTEAEIIQNLSLTTLLVGLGSILLIMGRMIGRMRRIRKAGLPIPPAFKRDLIWWMAFSVIILLPLANNFITGENLSSHLWWVVLRSLLSVIAVGVWLYFEFFVIDPSEPPNGTN
jgi:hypothetical protein